MQDPPTTSAALQVLLEDFRRRRPTRAWSLIITVFGDAVTPHGGEIWLGSLVEIMAAAEIDGGAVRTAMSRLTSEGWLARQRVGRNSYYALSADGRAAFEDAGRRVYGDPLVNWSGRWRLGVLPKGGEAAITRDQLYGAGFGQLGQRVVLAPSTAAETAGVRQLAELEPIWLEAAAAPADAARLAAAAWDLAPIAERYRRYTDLITAVERRLDGAAPPPRQAFAMRTLMIHAFRRVVLRDPCLPLPVLPADWPGRVAREATGDLYRRLALPSEAWLDEIGRARTGSLPPADQLFWARFGGLAPASTPAPRRSPSIADAG